MSFEQEVFGVICSFFVICMIAVGALEVRNWLRQRTLISGRQLIIRLLGNVLLLLLLLKVLYGIYWVEYARESVDYFLKYWGNCVGLAYLALTFAGVDVYYTWKLRRQCRRASKRMSQHLAKISA